MSKTTAARSAPSNRTAHRAASKAGAAAAFTAAATLVVGMVMYATLLVDFTTGSDPAAAVGFIADHHTTLYLWNLTITVVFGIALVPLVLALRERMTPAESLLPRAATVFGVMWAGLIIATGMIVNVGYESVLALNESDPAQAATVWAAIDTVANGTGGGNEIVGGVWVLLVTAATWQARTLPRWVCHLGLGTALAGLVTAVPGLQAVGAVFGLSLIVWFVGVGTALLRRGTAPVATEQPEQRLWSPGHV